MFILKARPVAIVKIKDLQKNLCFALDYQIEYAEQSLIASIDV